MHHSRDHLRELEIEEFMKLSLRGRPEVPGMAIDSDETIHPEDAFTVAEYGDGSFYVAVSFPEVGILDPNADTIKTIARSIIDEPDKPPKCKLPKARSMMHYGNGNEIPSLTVQGIFRPDRGITNPNIIRSRVKPVTFKYHDISELRQNPHYLTAEKFAYVFAKYQTKANVPDAIIHTFNLRSMGNVHPASVTEQFMIFANSVTGDLSKQAHLPQIYRVQEVDSEAGQQKSDYRSTPGFHESSNAEAYCDISNPVRKLGSWIVGVAISHYLSNGTNQLSLTEKEMKVFAGWRNRQRKVNIDERTGEIMATSA